MAKSNMNIYLIFGVFTGMWLNIKKIANKYLNIADDEKNFVFS